MLLYGNKSKTMDFSEAIVVYDVKVGRCSQLNDYMNLYEYQRSRSFIDFGPVSLRFNILIFLSSELLSRLKSNFICMGERKFFQIVKIT